MSGLADWIRKKRLKGQSTEALWARLSIGTIAAAALMLIFLFQRFDYMSILGGALRIDLSYNAIYAGNKVVRFLLNDACAIMLIYAIFHERKYVLFAFMVQVFGFLFFMIPYLVLKIQFEIIDGPLISFLHRLIVNPTLLMLLIPALWYQKMMKLK